jgi:uncharacterized protein
MQAEYTSENGTLSADQREQLNLLFSTPKGTVVLDRDFGIDRSCLDLPMPIAQTVLAAELAGQIPKYLTNLELAEIKPMEAKTDGTMTVKVVVRNVN